MNLTTSSPCRTKLLDRVLNAGLLTLAVTVGVIAGVVIAYDYTNLGLLGIGVLGFVGFVVCFEEITRRVHRRITLRPSQVVHVRSAVPAPTVYRFPVDQGGRHRR